MPSLSKTYDAALNQVAVIALPQRTHVQITGSDRASFLHNFCTQQIKTLAVGQGAEAFVTNIKGRILFHGVVYAGTDSLWFETEPGLAGALIAHLDRYLISEDVQLVDRTADLTQVYWSGPQAATNLASLLGETLPELTEPGQFVTDKGALVRRFSMGLAAGYSVVAPLETARELLVAAERAGLPLGTEALFELLRIEAGYPHSGVDITDDHLAQEASRTQRAIHFNKGCYLGQEPIARLDALGHVNRAFAGIETTEPTALPLGAEVFATIDASAVAGVLTSVTMHPITGRSLGLGVLKKALLVPNGPCYVGPSRIPGRVHIWEAPH